MIRRPANDAGKRICFARMGHIHAQIAYMQAFDSWRFPSDIHFHVYGAGYGSDFRRLKPLKSNQSHKHSLQVIDV
jgi:hypothetical protein